MRQGLFLSILPFLARGVLANTCKARGASSTSAADAADAASVDGDASSSAADIGGGLFASGGASTSGDAAASVTSAEASVVTSAGQTAASGGASGEAGDTDIAAAATSATLALTLAASDAANATSTVSSAATRGSASASSSATSSADDPMGTQVGTDLVLGEASEDCKCGYKISSLNDQYFPYQFSFAFSSVDDGSADSLTDQKWVLNDGDYVGGAANGNRCYGKKDNLYIDGGNLVLKVPKDQTASPNMECAEIAFEETNITGGIFQTTAMLSGVDGTCQAFWLNHSIATQYADEVDIEVISSTIDTDGIWYSNWPPNGDPNDPDNLVSAHTNVAVPDIDSSDPRKTYNNYTIAWLDDSTNRYYNGAKQDSPTENQPEHSMMFVINNWSNGGSGWTLGPPTGEDSLLKVKSVLLYYKTANSTQMSDLGGDCQESDLRNSRTHKETVAADDQELPLWKSATFGKAALPVTSASTACAVPPTRSDESTSAGEKSLWEVAHIVLDRDLFDIAPVKYLQISRYHYEKGIRRLYRHITITPKIIELLHESSHRPASKFLANFEFTETIALYEFSLLSSLHATIERLQNAESVIRKANTGWWGRRTSSSRHKDWTLPLFPTAHSFKMPLSSFFRAGEALSSESSGSFSVSRPEREIRLGSSLGMLFSNRMTQFITDADEPYSLVCIPVISLAEINFLLGGNLRTYTSLLPSKSPPKDAPEHFKNASMTGSIISSSLRQTSGTSFAPPANTIHFRAIRNDPPKTVRSKKYWEVIQGDILACTSIAQNTDLQVRYTYEIHLYQAEKARNEIVGLQGGITHSLLDDRQVRFIEVDYDAFGSV